MLDSIFKIQERKAELERSIDHLSKFDTDYKLLEQKTCFDAIMASQEEIKTFFNENKNAILIIYPGGKSYE